MKYLLAIVLTLILTLILFEYKDNFRPLLEKGLKAISNQAPPLTPENVDNPRGEGDIFAHTNKKRNVLLEFAQLQCPDIKDAIIKLSVISKNYAQRMAETELALEAIGKDPADDPDYQEWLTQFQSVVEKERQLFSALEDAYIAYTKLKFSPESPDMQSTLDNILHNASQSAKDAEEYYNGVRDELD